VAQAVDHETLFAASVHAQPSFDRGSSTAHLARELHDGVAGELSTMLLDLERFRVAQVGRQSVLAEIALLEEQLRFVLANVRKVLYGQRGLPGIELDFAGSLRRGFVRRFADRTGLRVHLSVSRTWPQAMPAETALNLRRIVQEALNNVDRHSGARSVLVRFDLPANGDWGVLSVADDGRGYPNLTDGLQAGFGLVGIQERAVLLGAWTAVSNRRRGGGKLTVTMPRGVLGL
jgi:signal transduction histidine kinase